MVKIEEMRAFVKDFFEKYYEQAKAKNEVLVKAPATDDNKPMWAKDAAPDEEGWVTWRLQPASVTEDELRELEKKLMRDLPEILRAFLTTYYHYFEGGIGQNPAEHKFAGILNAWNPLLVKSNYMPFAWDKEGVFILCLDLTNLPDEEKCQVVRIDHEILFDFDENTTERAALAAKMEPVAENFWRYLAGMLEG